MLSLIRRHFVLTVFTVIAVLLVLIGWWLRPDMNTAPAEKAAEEATAVQPDSRYRAVDSGRDVSGSGDVEDDGPVGCAGVFVEMESLPPNLESAGSFDDLVAQALRDVDNASTPEQVVFAAHLSKFDRAEQLRILTNGVNAMPGSAYLMWTAVNACVRTGQQTECPDLDAWVQQLLTLDGENALAWSVAADAYLTLGRDEDALEAMRRASISYTVNEYWIEDIQASWDAVTAYGGFSEGRAPTEAIGISAAFVKPTSYYQVCKRKVDESVDWANACLALGKTIDAGAKTYLLKSFGRGMQRIARIAAGEDPDSEELLAMKAVQIPDGYMDEPYRYPDSPKILLENMLVLGEIAAFERLAEINRERLASGYEANCDVIRLDY